VTTHTLDAIARVEKKIYCVLRIEKKLDAVLRIEGKLDAVLKKFNEGGVDSAAAEKDHREAVTRVEDKVDAVLKMMHTLAAMVNKMRDQQQQQ